MGLGRHKSVFPVVSVLILCLATTLIGLHRLRAFIPPGQGSGFVVRDEDYLQVGGTQTIPWRPLDSEVFAEARRLDKPVFLLIGDMCCRLARAMDATALRDRDVVDLLRQQFLCVRIDASDQPAWAQAYLPVSRAVLGFEPLLQVWILDPSGRIVHQGLIRSDTTRPDRFWLLDVLRSGLAALTRERAVENPTGTPWQSQRAELDAMLRSDAGTPDYDAHAQFLAAQIDPEHGGLPVNLRQAIRPFAWQFLVRQGQMDLLTRVLDPALASPLVDWLDGGFFRQTRRLDWSMVEYDKLAQNNAEAMSFLAVVARATGNRFYRELSERTFDALYDSFRDGRYVRAYRVGDGDEMGRSAHSSFPPRVLRQHFSPQERAWLRKNFGLRVEDNPGMIVRIRDPSLLADRREQVDAYLKRLRAIPRGEEPPYGGEQQMDVAGTVAARMLEAGRVMGDDLRMTRAAILSDSLRSMRAGQNEVVHSLRSGGTSYRGLRDYLGFADAMLAEHLCFGRSPSLQEGFEVLKRGVKLFSEGYPGGLVDAKWEESGPGPQDAPSPGLTDDLGESTVAQAIRLCNAYGTLNLAMNLDAASASDPVNLKQVAMDIVGRFAPVANQMGNRVSAYFCSALEVERDVAVIVTGPGAVDRANTLARRLPATLVAPATDALRPMLARRPPGNYVIKRGSFIGPLTEDETVRQAIS